MIDTATPFAPRQTYTVRDWNLSEVFRLKHTPDEGIGEFDVFNTSNLLVAKYTTNWNPTLPEYIGVDHLYGVTFPADMDVAEKVLLLAGLFTLVCGKIMIKLIFVQTKIQF